MYEVELKIEILESEKEAYLQTLKSKGFSFIKSSSQHDVYIEAKESPHGGYDLKRYRHEDDKYIYTEKIWEVTDDNIKARKENEREVTHHEFACEVAKYPEVVSFKKQRDWYTGIYDNHEISLTIDSVKFDDSSDMRYFTEAEIGVENKEEVGPTKQIIIGCLKELLGKEELYEAPGMFMMAFKKL